MFFALAISFYIIAFLFLFFFPLYSHRKNGHPIIKKIMGKTKMFIMAHRGGSLENFENSHTAFSSCIV